MFNARLHPFSQTVLLQSDPAADFIANIFRFPTAGQVLGAYAVNDANIASATDMVAIHILNKGTSGTATATTVTTFADTVGWTADVPRTGTVANTKFAAGEWVAVSYDESGTGLPTRMTIQVDYMLNAYEN